MARTAAPQVPGEAAPPAEKPADDLVGEAAPAVETDELTTLRAELAAMKQMMTGIISARSQPIPTAAVKEADLPDQSTIDPKKIESPTLSKQGWVVPHSFGAPPVARVQVV